jgi:hypothetical protein
MIHLVEEIDDFIIGLIHQSQYENTTTNIYIHGAINRLSKKRKYLIEKINQTGTTYTEFDHGIVR